MNATNPDGSVTVTVPLEITVRLASGAVPSAPASVGAALAACTAGPVRTLPAPARQSRWMPTTTTVVVTTRPSSRQRRRCPAGNGSQPAPRNCTVARQSGRRAERAAALRALSLVLHKTRRMAIFTATNIDGATYLSVDRQSGRVGDPEGEKWFRDTRVSDAYAQSGTLFGMVGLLRPRSSTRRTDPDVGFCRPKRSAPTPTPSASPTARRSISASTRPPSSGRAPSASCWRTVCRQRIRQAHLRDPGPIFNDTIDLWADDADSIVVLQDRCLARCHQPESGRNDR